MATPSHYTLSSVPFIRQLQERWLADRGRRSRHVPPERSWRGCLGLAMLLERPDDTQYVAGRALLPNERVTWMALRDVPPGHFPGSGPMLRRGVSYANAARATLRHGMPHIDLSRPDREGVDFRFFPGARRSAPDGGQASWHCGDVLDGDAHPRELEVLVRLSEAMTRTAFGRAPIPRGSMQLAKDWMSVPYLAFPVGDVPALAGRLLRRPPSALREAFCGVAESGLFLRAHADATYLGWSGRPSGTGADHVFRSHAVGPERRVRVPRSAELLVRAGEAVEAGQPWCRLIPCPTKAWTRRPPAARWRTLSDVLPATASVQVLLRAWLGDQVLTPPTRPDLRLIEARLVAGCVAWHPPAGLWWDLSPTEPHLDGVLEAAVFAPVRTHAWHALRLALRGEVDLNAAIGDPRLDLRDTKVEPRRSRPAVVLHLNRDRGAALALAG